MTGSFTAAGRTAYVADHASTSLTGRRPDGVWWSVGCAVVVDDAESSDLRREARGIIAEKTRNAAIQAGGMEPVTSLLFLVGKAPVRCVVTHHRGTAGTARYAERIRQLGTRALLEALVTDGVGRIVLPHHPAGPSPTRDARLLVEWAVPATVHLFRIDAVSEPLLRLPDAIAWWYHHDLQHSGRKWSATSQLSGRLRAIAVG